MHKEEKKLPMRLIKKLFKLLNNVAYEKTMENMRKRMIVRVT